MNIKDFKWTEKRFGTRFANILKNLIAVRKDSTETTLEYEDTQGNVTKLVTDSNFSSILAKNGLIEVKWQELKDKCDNGELIPGSLYRITDYNCTTTQENTQSAGHQFDIVLLALSENKLAEEGWAMMHENDTYFANSNLSAWKVWYCLDNDKSRFAWADDSVDEDVPAKIQTNGEKSYTFPTGATFIRDEQYDEIDKKSGKTFYAWVKDDDNSTIAYTISNPPLVWKEHYLYIKLSRNFVQAKGNRVDGYTPAHEGTGLPNGRGVIYRLIDEWNNDVPCDFKNILVVIKGVENYIINNKDHMDDRQDYSMLGSIKDITVSLCLINDGVGGNKNAIPIGTIAPSLRYGEVIYNIKISSNALVGAGQLTDIRSNNIIGYTIV